MSVPARPRSGSRNDSLPGGIEIRRARQEDVAAIAALEAIAFPHPWRPEFYESEVASTGRFNRVAFDGDRRLVGYVFAMHILDEMHINKIAVAPAQRRHGIATMLMHECFEFAHDQRMRVLSLEVRESNLDAIAFYERLRFTRWSTRKGYYPDGENAVIMALELAVE